MAAPYHADATGIPSGAPSIAAHTPNRHSNGTSGHVYSPDIQGRDQQLLLSDLEGVALFGEHELSILKNDLPSHRTDISTGTPSFATQSTDRKAKKGTNRDVVTSMRDYNNDDRSSETNTEGVALFGEGANLILKNDALSSRTGISTGTLSFATQSTNRKAKGTNRDISANLPLPRTDVVDINGVALSNAAGVLPQDLIQQNDVKSHLSHGANGSSSTMPMHLTFRAVLHPWHHTLLTVTPTALYSSFIQGYDQRSLLSDLDGPVGDTVGDTVVEPTRLCYCRPGCSMRSSGATDSPMAIRRRQCPAASIPLNCDRP
eukprot:scaffold113903_cov57-Attheya_sp.AAC.1